MAERALSDFERQQLEGAQRRLDAKSPQSQNQGRRKPTKLPVSLLGALDADGDLIGDPTEEPSGFVCGAQIPEGTYIGVLVHEEKIEAFGMEKRVGWFLISGTKTTLPCFFPINKKSLGGTKLNHTYRRVTERAASRNLWRYKLVRWLGNQEVRLSVRTTIHDWEKAPLDPDTTYSVVSKILGRADSDKKV